MVRRSQEREQDSSYLLLALTSWLQKESLAFDAERDSGHYEIVSLRHIFVFN